MFYNINSHSQGQLLEHLVQALDCSIHQAATADGSLLYQPMVLVDNPGMQHFLNLHLAGALGVTFGISYPLPSTFLYQLARRLVPSAAIPEQSPYKRELVRWRILSLVNSSAAPQSVIDHMNRLGWLGLPLASRLQQQFCFAAELADAFEQYQIYRSDWLAAWEIGAQVPELSDQQQHLQRDVWACLRKDIMQYEAAATPHEVLQVLLDYLPTADSDAIQAQIPRSIYVFGVTSLSPMQLNCLAALSSHVDLYLYWLNPCPEEFWFDDVVKRAKPTISSIDWEAEEPLPRPQLLSNLGRQCAVFASQLLTLQEACTTHWIDQPLVAYPQPDTLLNRLKISLLEGAHHTNDESPAVAADSSIEVHCCSSALRELQVLHDRLLHLLYVDPSILPQDIVVMMPQVENYSRYIEQVFDVIGSTKSSSLVRSEFRLKASLADRVSVADEPEVGALLKLFSVAQSRFEIDTVGELLQLSPIRERFELEAEDVDCFLRWCRNANIKWGVDGKDRYQALMQSHQGSVADESAMQWARYGWQWGIKRLLKGLIAGTGSDTNGQWVNGDWVTGDVYGLQADVLGRCLQCVQEVARISEGLEHQQSLTAWIQEGTSWLTLFSSEAESDERMVAIVRSLEILQTQADAAQFQHSISGELFLQVWSEQLSKARSKNYFMVGAVTFCSLLPMRSIPFKVVVMLGLQQSVFPRQSSLSELNLMKKAPRWTDRSRTADDQYSVLEAALSAERYLWLFYQGMDPTSLEKQHPSSVIESLFADIESVHKANLKLQDWIITHELHAFSPPRDHTAEALSQPRHLAMRIRSQLLPETSSVARRDHATTAAKITDTLGFQYWSQSSLLAYLKHPLHQRLREQHQLYFPFLQSQEASDEPFSPDFVAGKKLFMSALFALFDGSSVDQVVAMHVASADINPDLPAYAQALKIIAAADYTHQRLSQRGFEYLQLQVNYASGHGSIGLSLDGFVNRQGQLALINYGKPVAYYPVFILWLDRLLRAPGTELSSFSPASVVDGLTHISGCSGFSINTQGKDAAKYELHAITANAVAVATTTGKVEVLRVEATQQQTGVSEPSISAMNHYFEQVQEQNCWLSYGLFSALFLEKNAPLSLSDLHFPEDWLERSITHRVSAQDIIEQWSTQLDLQAVNQWFASKSQPASQAAKFFSVNEWRSIRVTEFEPPSLTYERLNRLYCWFVHFTDQHWRIEKTIIQPSWLPPGQADNIEANQ